MRSPALLLVAMALFCAPLHADPIDTVPFREIPKYDVSDPKAVEVTPANLLASERFWPYRVTLREAFRPSEHAPVLAQGDVGVLVRVEPSGAARIDFARDGVHDVPVGATDLIAEANRIRRGEAWKKGPNFAFAVGPRLVDPSGDALRPFLYAEALEYRGFLAVFADPSAPDFSDLAAQLEPLRRRDGVLTLLFPQTRDTDAQTRERLRAVGWPVPFVYGHLAEGYTASLLPGGTTLPALTLQTREGRLLFQRAWTPSALADLIAALARELPDAPTVSRLQERGKDSKP